MGHLLKDLDKLIMVTQVLFDSASVGDHRVDEQINVLRHCKSVYLEIMEKVSEHDKDTVHAMVRRTISQIEQVLIGPGHLETAVSMLKLTTTTFERLLQFHDAFMLSR